MAKKVISDVKGTRPTKAQMEAIDDNFTEVYAQSDAGNAADIATNAADIATNLASIQAIEDGTGNSLNLAEYADNAAAVTGGLSIGDLYTTTGTVKVVTA